MTSPSKILNKLSIFMFSFKLIVSYQMQVMKECNCTDSSFLSLFADVRQSKTNDEINCAFAVYNQLFLSENFIKEVCIPLCPLECNRTEYKVSISALQLLGDDFVDYIKKNERLSKDFNKKSINAYNAGSSVVKVNIFYDSMSYTLSTESAKMNLVSLLASIGGNLGLFLGVSVFSLCELIEVAIEIYFLKRVKNSIF